jgi:hypothetical protein
MIRSRNWQQRFTILLIRNLLYCWKSAARGGCNRPSCRHLQALRSGGVLRLAWQQRRCRGGTDARRHRAQKDIHASQNVTEIGGDQPAAGRKANALQQPLQLSDELAAVIGTEF